jgi:hypothetical protein
MTVNNSVRFTTNNQKMATRSTASQFHSLSQTTFQATMQSTNIVFGRSSTSVGMVATQFQSQNAVFSVGKPRAGFENWCISDHYKVPLEEVLPTLKQLRQELESKDFHGMTDFEIYEYIENRFIQTFGEDFRMAQHLGLDDPISNCPEFLNFNNKLVIGAFSGNEETSAFFASLDRNNRVEIPEHIQKQMTLQHSYNFRHIANTFDYILQGHFGDYVGGPNFTRDVNRARLFGDMSRDEIMDTIRAKYPENLTYRDLALMTGEMYDVGVLGSRWGGFGDYAEYNPDGSLKRMLSQNEHNENIIKNLNLPIRISDLVKGYNYVVQHLRRGESMPQGMLESRDFLIKYLGAVMGPNGLL